MFENFLEDEDTFNKNFKLLIVIITGIIVFIIASTYKPSNYIPINATIESIGSTGYGKSSRFCVRVDYIYDNIKYKNVKYDAYKLGWHSGQEITVYIDPNNPTKLYSNRLIKESVFVIFLLIIVSILKKLRQNI